MGVDELDSDHPTAWAELCILVGNPRNPQVLHRKSLDEFVGVVIETLAMNGQRKGDTVEHLQKMIDSWVRRAS